MLNGIQGIFWALKVRPVWGPLYSLEPMLEHSQISPRLKVLTFKSVLNI